MSLSDTDSTDLWDEIHRRLGIEDRDEAGKISPLVTLVKPIRLVTLIKQDTVMLGQDTCPPGAVDMPPSVAASTTATPADAALHTLLDRRFAAYDRARETAERTRQDELLATVERRLRLIEKTDLLGSRGRSVRTESHSSASLEESIDNVRSELREVHRLLTRSPQPSGQLVTSETQRLAPSSPEPERADTSARSSGQATATSPTEPPAPQSGVPKIHRQAPTELPSAAPSRPWMTLFPWSALLLLALASVFFTCGVLVHAMLPGSPLGATSELRGAATAPSPSPSDQDPAEAVAAEGSPRPASESASRPSPDTPTPGPSTLLDSDGDGLYDPGQPGLQAATIDRCPSTPGPSERQGCPDPAQVSPLPEPEPPEPLRALDGVIEGVHFDVDRATLRADSIETLDRAVAVLRQHPAARIEISGHTDSAGGYQHNIELSQARAETVRRYLIDRGLDPDRLETAGYGPDRPLDDNRTRAGRLRNRRIEFRLLK